MEKLIPKPFPHHRERSVGSVEKGLVPSLLSLRIPFPQPPHGERQGLERLPSLSTWRQKEAIENESTLASFSSQLTKAKKSFLLDY